MDYKVVATADPSNKFFGPAVAGVVLVSAMFDLVDTEVGFAPTRADLPYEMVDLVDIRVDWVVGKTVFFIAKVVETTVKVSPAATKVTLAATKVFLIAAKVSLAAVKVIEEFLEEFPISNDKFHSEFNHMHCNRILTRLHMRTHLWNIRWNL